MTDRHRFANVELRVPQRQVRIDGHPVALGARAFDLIVALVERHDRVVAKNELIELVWPGLVVEENNLQVQISALRKVFGASAVATIPGRGYRFALPIESEERREKASAADEQPRGSSHLPLLRTRFIGREGALSDGARLLAESRLLTLTGIGGCGKTRLAVELARREAERCADGVWFVDLAPIQDGERVLAAVAEALGAPATMDLPLASQLAAHVAPRETLLVLDNCEHLIDAVVEVVELLLASGERVRVLATSREAFGIADEQIYPVQSLSQPATATLVAALESEAVRVFVDRARLGVPEFALDESNVAVVAEICRRLDGIALAIELAAARVALLSPDEIRSRLDDRFRLLTGGRRAVPRHQTLHAMMSWSHEQLSEAEQRLFRQLSVFVGGWTLAAAGVVAESDEYDVLALLTALHDKSLLYVERNAQGRPRYRMLETVRQYAQDRLDESGESEAVRDRHLEHFVAFAEQLEPLYRDTRQGEAIALMRPEQENALAAKAWCPHTSDGRRLGLRLAAASWQYWRTSAQLERGRALAVAALDHAAGIADPVPNDERAARRLTVGLATTLYYMGQYEESRVHATRALALARAAGDLVCIADCLTLLNTGTAPEHDDAEVNARFAEIRTLASRLGDRVLLARTLNNIGERHRARGQAAEAAACYEEAMAIVREAGHPSASSVIACNYARLLIAAGDLERAGDYLRESAALAKDNGLPAMDRHLLEVGAALAAARGRHPGAARLHGAAVVQGLESGARREPVDEAFIAPLLERSRAALGAEIFRAREDASRALKRDAALEELTAELDKGP